MNKSEKELIFEINKLKKEIKNIKSKNIKSDKTKHLRKLERELKHYQKNKRGENND